MLTRTASNLFSKVARFHADEGGMEPVQAILLVAVGALVLVGLNKIWQDLIKPGVEKNLTEVLSKSYSA